LDWEAGVRLRACAGSLAGDRTWACRKWSPDIERLSPHRPGESERDRSSYLPTKEFGLTGGIGPNFNHAKVGVSTSGEERYSIFGDMNQQGAASGKCSSSQNGRGGLFYGSTIQNCSKAW